MIDRRNPLRSAAATATAPAEPLLAMGLAGTAAAAALAVSGLPRAAGIVLACAATALLLAVVATAPRAQFVSYVRNAADGIADVAVLAALAWPLRAASVRISAAAVCAIGLVVVGAYAQVRAAALRYRVPLSIEGAPERSLVLAAGLVLPSLLETTLWILAAAGAVAFARTAASVWVQRT